MLQQPTADDYVIATGISHSVRDLVSIAFSRVGLDWEKYVRVDPKFLRPAEVDHLIGNPAKAKRVLGWEPEVDFKQLVEMMVDADMERLAGSSWRRQPCRPNNRAHPPSATPFPARQNRTSTSPTLTLGI